MLDALKLKYQSYFSKDFYLKTEYHKDLSKFQSFSLYGVIVIPASIRKALFADDLKISVVAVMLN